jgi:hypothetical protein
MKIKFCVCIEKMFEEEIAILLSIRGCSPLERHVRASLERLSIIRPIHFGTWGDPPHFNIRTPYSGEIHVYVHWTGECWQYATMTEG